MRSKGHSRARRNAFPAIPRLLSRVRRAVRLGPNPFGTPNPRQKMRSKRPSTLRMLNAASLMISVRLGW